VACIFVTFASIDSLLISHGLEVSRKQGNEIGVDPEVLMIKVKMDRQQALLESL